MAKPAPGHAYDISGLNVVFGISSIFLFVTTLWMIWSILLPAPLEQPANPADSPNPSKAPWYFLGLQEMLVYFDPWLAGVVFPTLIVVGLMAIPYIDTNPQRERLLHFQRAARGDRHLSLRLSRPLDTPRDFGDVSARAELELLRAL